MRFGVVYVVVMRVGVLIYYRFGIVLDSILVVCGECCVFCGMLMIAIVSGLQGGVICFVVVDMLSL